MSFLFLHLIIIIVSESHKTFMAYNKYEIEIFFPKLYEFAYIQYIKILIIIY